MVRHSDAMVSRRNLRVSGWRRVDRARSKLVPGNQISGSGNDNNGSWNEDGGSETRGVGSANGGGGFVKRGWRFREPWRRFREARKWFWRRSRRLRESLEKFPRPKVALPGSAGRDLRSNVLVPRTATLVPRTEATVAGTVAMVRKSGVVDLGLGFRYESLQRIRPPVSPFQRVRGIVGVESVRTRSGPTRAGAGHTGLRGCSAVRPCRQRREIVGPKSVRTRSGPMTANAGHTGLHG